MKSQRQKWAEFIAGKNISKQTNCTYRIRQNFTGTVLGIDPSLRGTGLAVVKSISTTECRLLHSTTIKCAASLSRIECIRKIFEETSAIIRTYRPDVCAAEETIYVQNFQTAQVMGMARGAIFAAISQFDLQIHEFAPLRIKQAITGFGRASKEQVSKMIQAILSTSTANVGFDETDAAAAALCYIFTS